MRSFCLSCLMLFASFSVMGLEVVQSLGFDFQNRFISAENTLGGKQLFKKYLQGGLYGSLKLNDRIGVEIGYQAMNTRQKREIMGDDTVYFGDGLANVSPDFYLADSKLSVKGFYAGVLGLVPISDSHPISFIASLGLARNQVRILSTINFVSTTGTIETDGTIKFAEHKWIPRVGGGFQYMLRQHLGLRALATWEQTARFKGMKGAFTAGQSGTFLASLKNSTTLGLGLFYDF